MFAHAHAHVCAHMHTRAHTQEDYKRLEAAGIKTSEDLLELELEDITAIAQHLSLSTKKRLTRFAQLSPEVYYIHIWDILGHIWDNLYRTQRHDLLSSHLRSITHMHTFVHACTHEHVHKYVHVCVCVCVCVCVRVCVCVCVCVCCVCAAVVLN